MRHISVGRPENQRRDLVIVAVLLIASWALASLDSSNELLGLTRALRGSVLAPFIAADDLYEERAALTRRVVRLEVERDRLYRDGMVGADLAHENEELRGLLRIPPRERGSMVVAELVPARPITGASHSFLLRATNIGRIEVPTGVSVPEGLVGVLRSVAGGTGLGEFWTHPDFRVSVRSAVGNATGIVRATTLEDGTRLMMVEGVPFQARVPPGTVLVTAGLGGVFPPGIPVGSVLAEAESRSGWSHSYLVEPSVRPGSVTAVTAWSRPSQVEQTSNADAAPEPVEEVEADGGG